MGGADQVLTQARQAFAEGDYRWVAQLVNHLVFAEPDNTEARELQADALEQLVTRVRTPPGAMPTSVARRNCAQALPPVRVAAATPMTWCGP